MAVVQGAHDGKVFLAAPRAGRLVDYEMTGIALVAPLVYRNILKPLESTNQFPLFLAPLHAIQ